MKTFAMKRLALSLSAALLLSGGLTACVPLVIGGAAAAGGTLVVTDRRTSGAQLEDEGIELRGGSRIRSAIGDRGRINIVSYNRQVLLTGDVPTAQDKQTAEQILSRVENVTSVVNELSVGFNASLSQRSSDTLLTGRVKSMLIDAPDLFANSFKVVTERGTVYLMGRVTQREADRATNVVRSTPGVAKVVRVLEVISEEELSRQSQAVRPRQPAPAQQPAQQPANQ